MKFRSKERKFSSRGIRVIRVRVFEGLGRGEEGRAPDPSFPLIFHENPASRTVFHRFPVFFKKNTFVTKNLIAAKVNHDCKMQIDPQDYCFQ